MYTCSFLPMQIGVYACVYIYLCVRRKTGGAKKERHEVALHAYVHTYNQEMARYNTRGPQILILYDSEGSNLEPEEQQQDASFSHLLPSWRRDQRERSLSSRKGERLLHEKENSVCFSFLIKKD